MNAGLIRVFHSVFAAVSDIFGYGFGTIVGGQSRIHEYPVFAVKFDNFVGMDWERSNAAIREA